MAVLRSSLVGLSDEALLRLRLNASSLDAGLEVPLDGFAPEEVLTLERFRTNLRLWRASLQIIPLDVLIARALRPSLDIGDEIELELTKEGRDAHQAVGYLADGTMIVTNHARERMGQTVLVTIASALQTSAGRLLFAELALRELEDGTSELGAASAEAGRIRRRRATRP